MANPPVRLILDPITATATFEGLDEHVESIAIPIGQLAGLTEALSSLDARIDTLEAVKPTAITYTVSFNPAPTS